MTEFVKRSQVPQEEGREVEEYGVGGFPPEYGSLHTALQLYRTTGLHTARQLRSIARQMADSQREWLRRRRDGYAVRGGGSAVAAGAAILGMVVAGPAFMATMVVGTVVAVGGQVALARADRKNESHEAGFIKRVEQLYQEFEKEAQRVQESVRRHVPAGTPESKVLDELLSIIKSDCRRRVEGTHGIPSLIENVINNIKNIQGSVNTNQLGELWNTCGPLWGFFAPLIGLEGAGLAEGLAKHSATTCTHSTFATCDSKPAKSTNFNCYSTFGKVLYVFGIAVNLANTTISALEVAHLQRRLKLLAGMTEAEQVEALGGLAEELSVKGQVMEDTINIICGELVLG